MEKTKLQRIQKIAERRISESSPQEEHPAAFAMAEVFQDYAPHLVERWYEANEKINDMNTSPDSLPRDRQIEEWSQNADSLFVAMEAAYRETAHWYEGLSQRHELDLATLTKENQTRWNVGPYGNLPAYPAMAEQCDRNAEFLERRTLRISPGQTPRKYDAHWYSVADFTNGLAMRLKILKEAALRHTPKFSDTVLRFAGFIRDDLHRIFRFVTADHTSGSYYQVVEK